MRPIALSGYRELKRHFEDNPQAALANLRENLEDGTLKPDQFSVRQLFEALVEDGREILDMLDPRRKGGGKELLEIADSVSTTDFANSMGQVIFSRIFEGYRNPNFLWPDLCTQQQTPFPYGERVPGVGPVGDKMETIGEGEQYPVAGLNEIYIDIPPTVKKGLIVNVTREAVVFDRTGQILREAGDLGYSFGLQMEKRVIDVATGQVNTYKRNGVATNTFLASGAYVNVGGGTLTDWTSIQTAELLFDAMTDPSTSEPITLEAAQLLVPSALKRTANRIMMASELQMVDNQTNATTYRTVGPNPLGSGFYGQPTYRVLSNAFVKARTGSDSIWYFGDFKKAITRFYNWDMEIDQAGASDQLRFERDIWFRSKISSRDIVAVLEPRYLSKSA